MRIGYDGKRAFFNNTGLGFYSRTLVHSMAKFFPNHQYVFFTPKENNESSNLRFIDLYKSIEIVQPKRTLSKTFRSIWRLIWMTKDIKDSNVDIYHGLSHELPIGVEKLNIKTVVTIHDLIFERFPAFYPFIDRWIYRRKFKSACKRADLVVAISEQTKKDIIEFYKVPPQKIKVIYQSCNTAFYTHADENERAAVREMYALPKTYLLYVGTINERKNLLQIVKALNTIKEDYQIPLVVIGNGGAYKEKVHAYIAENKLDESIVFLSNIPTKVLPTIYQMAEMFIYPSVFEGFGIPILEALQSGIPVITSNGSCFPEVGGDAAIYIDPNNHNDIAKAIIKILNDNDLKAEMIEKGILQAKQFENKNIAKIWAETYQNLLK